MSVRLDVASPCFMFCLNSWSSFSLFFPTFLIVDTMSVSKLLCYLIYSHPVSTPVDSQQDSVAKSCDRFVSRIHVQDLSHKSTSHLHGTGEKKKKPNIQIYLLI